MNTNRMIEFAKNERTTTYFRDYAIQEIRLAYRIMEYLAPDTTFPPKINEETKTLIFYGRYDDAVERIIDEELICTDLGSSSGNDALKHNAIELMKYLLPIYKQNLSNTKEKRRLELLEELQKLEATDETK